MNKNLSMFLSVGVAVAIFSGCGGSNGTAIDEKNIGYYKGSSIVGVNYVCGKETGKTETGGKFEFEDGKGCTFSIGDLVLKKVKASGLNNGVKIKETDEKVIALLMTLDIDNDEELKVTAESIKALKDNNISKIKNLDNTKLEEIAKSLSADVAKIDDAKKHIENSKNNSDLKKLLAGKTFYAVDNSKDDDEATEVSFNDDATKMTKKEENETFTTTIIIKGNKISVVEEKEYGIFIGETNNYILFNDFDEDGEADGQSRFYYDKSKANAYLKEPIDASDKYMDVSDKPSSAGESSKSKATGAIGTT